MSQYGEPTNYNTIIDGKIYDLSKLFVPSYYITRQGYKSEFQPVGGITVLETVIFDKPGYYMVLLTFTPLNNNSDTKESFVTFSTSNTGGEIPSTLNCLYLKVPIGGDDSIDSITKSGTLCINVTNILTWYLVFNIYGTDGSGYRYNLNIIPLAP